ncbi:hypothetical protein HS088_TW11G00857 [Tripterygium wilfordii]|uniref:Uncharacterized protein n=1 Tax=Tripterygium wilfordii TaxID=458696 RepID=A0A7J7D3E7_TRIWF|nr:uncharacterized protein LOC120009625 [Tripterygium wilfordii]KAF5740779.1 hypothetical protein HS088_TW11G00857 [Tripterygium wilfordii]
MGSLMAGWDSPANDPKLVKYRRNKSCTKENIESYWRSKKQVEEEHLKAISSSPSASGGGQKELTVGDYEAKFQRSSSLPPSTNKKEDFMDMRSSETTLEDIIKKNGWWRRSNLAFLNEPPVLERASNTYVSQFHIASIGPAKGDAVIATN